MPKISNEQRKEIQNYAKQIKTIYNFRDAVRLRSGMYIGSKQDAFITMVREIFQNSLDEIVKGHSIDNNIYINYDERVKTISIQDSGRGIPFNNMVRIFTDPHTSSNYVKKKGEYSSGLNGIGGKICAALSSVFEIESHILGEGRILRLEDFTPWKFGEKKIKLKKGDFPQGTKVTFHPCTILEDSRADMISVLNRVKSILPMAPIGATIYFRGIDLNGKIYEEKIENKDGIMTYLIGMTTSPLIKPIYIHDDNGEMKADILFTYDSENMDEEKIIAFSNFCPTVNSSSHVVGFIDGLTKYFKNYMNKIYLATSNKKKKNKLVVTNNDIKTGLISAVIVSHLNPDFTGQAKEILSNKDMIPFVRDLMVRGLEEWSKANPSDLLKLCGYFKGIAIIRTNAENGKVKLSNNYKASSLNGLPLKYTQPSGKEHLELILVEGDSAKGAAKNSRNPKTQGIMPLRGKIPNAFSTNKKDFIGNDEISGMICIIGDKDGNNYGKNFDINKVPFEKIILMPDADPDGAHIRSLLVRFFMRYMPALITSGKVYAAKPPLFGIKLGKGKYKYFTDKIDFIEYEQKIFSKNNMVQFLNNKKLSDKEIIELIYDNEDYTYELNIISNDYAIDPNLLEFLLIHRNDSITKLKSAIKKEYRFISDFQEKNGTLIIKGLLNQKTQLIFLNDKLLKVTEPLYNKYIANNPDLYYLLNGKRTSLYNFMKAFESVEPNGLIRYKGLGEMNPSQLGESTLLPEHRTLVQYTWESALKEIGRAEYLDKNKREFIKDMKVRRLDLMG